MGGGVSETKTRWWQRRRDDHAPKALIDRSSFNPLYPFDVGLDETVILQTLLGSREQIAPDFLSFVQRAYRESPILFALIANRMHLFQQARFQWRERINGRPGDMFGNEELTIIERPWPGANTGRMLALAEVHDACAGNFFAARQGDRLRIMRPDWTAIVLGSDQDEDVAALDLNAEVLGYLYWEGGYAAGRDPVTLLPEWVVHYMPTPDPECPWRGMAWLRPIITELCSDKEMTEHKRKYLQGGATPNLGIVLDPTKLNIKSPDDFNAWVAAFVEKREEAGGNPYRTLFLAGGADPVVLGSHLAQIDFSKVQGSGEVRMAAAAMVHPSIVAIEAGLEGSALNAGNFEAAFRQFANGTIRPNWETMAGALERVVTPPRANVELWYDDRDIPALQEDAKKLAETFKSDAETASTLWNAGWEPDSIIDAVNRKDMTLLKGKHSGLDPVQGQKPSENTRANGSGKREAVPAP